MAQGAVRLVGLLVAVVVALALGIVAPDVFAQAYPVRPVRLIIPFSPGGAADVPSRAVMQRLSEALGQQVVIENRGKANLRLFPATGSGG